MGKRSFWYSALKIVGEVCGYEDGTGKHSPVPYHPFSAVVPDQAGMAFAIPIKFGFFPW